MNRAKTKNKRKMHSYFLKQIFTVTFYSKIEITSRGKKKKKKNISSSHTQTKGRTKLTKVTFFFLENTVLFVRPDFHLHSQLQVLIEKALVCPTPACCESLPLPTEKGINIPCRRSPSPTKIKPCI